MSSDQVTAGAKSEQVKAYLESTVVPVLTQALTQMCISEPDDPFSWLAQVKEFFFDSKYLLLS